jgi:heme/copper-type cytochrome/quinol oxidase subunit 2
LPTPAIAVDPARSGAGKNPSSNKSPNAPFGGLVVIAIAAGVVALLVLSLLVTAVWFNNKRKRKQMNGYRAGFMSPTSPFSSQQPSGILFLTSIYMLFMQDAILSLFDYRKKIYELSFGVVLLIVLADCVRLLPENFLHLA